jgi:hypothetical protein
MPYHEAHQICNLRRIILSRRVKRTMPEAAAMLAECPFTLQTRLLHFVSCSCDDLKSSGFYGSQCQGCSPSTHSQVSPSVRKATPFGFICMHLLPPYLKAECFQSWFEKSVAMHLCMLRRGKRTHDVRDSTLFSKILS